MWQLGASIIERGFGLFIGRVLADIGLFHSSLEVGIG